jgi:hypothetical protein
MKYIIILIGLGMALGKTREGIGGEEGVGQPGETLNDRIACLHVSDTLDSIPSLIGKSRSLPDACPRIRLESMNRNSFAWSYHNSPAQNHLS